MIDKNNQETNSRNDLDLFFSNVLYDRFQSKAQSTVKAYEPASEKKQPFSKNQRISLLIPADERSNLNKELEPFLVNPHAILGQVTSFYDDYQIELKTEGFSANEIEEMRKYDLSFLMRIYQQLNPNYEQEYKEAAKKHAALKRNYEG